MKKTTALKSHFIPHTLRAMALAVAMLFGAPVNVWAAILDSFEGDNPFDEWNLELNGGSVTTTDFFRVPVLNFPISPIYDNVFGILFSGQEGVARISRSFTISHGQLLEVNAKFITDTPRQTSSDFGHVTINGVPVLSFNSGNAGGGLDYFELSVPTGVPFILGFEVGGQGAGMAFDGISTIGDPAPVPLPPTLGLVSVALLGIAWRARRA